jgi:ribonuclease P protein component
LPNDETSHFGLIVPLKPFKSAVKRNYARRRLREFYRLNKNLFPENQEVIIRLFVAPDNWSKFLEQITKLLEKYRNNAVTSGGE